ncbi:hypothetical protein P692DRAFT_20913265 [Suillus brevipes Sb2]|nr:hypothetical protein P692DRAFT_20913265 [Suillus brevipes Sb2]
MNQNHSTLTISLFITPNITPLPTYSSAWCAKYSEFIYSASTYSLLRFLVWLIWCCAARWSLFHKSYRRSCYASGLYSKAEEDALVVSTTSRSNLCQIDLFQNSSIYASLQQEHLGNRIANSCRNRQRLELSWSSSIRMRT